MFGLALLFVYVFLLSFKHFDHLAWGRGNCSLCLSCVCLLAVHTLICVTFSLPPGVGGWLRPLLVARPGLFCLLFSSVVFYVIFITLFMKKDYKSISSFIWKASYIKKNSIKGQI